jgi:hypothetical protein
MLRQNTDPMVQTAVRASTSFRSVSVKPTLARTRRDAVFQSRTVAHKRSYPDDFAQSRTASEASVAYP